MPPVFYKRGWVADAAPGVLRSALDRAGEKAPGEGGENVSDPRSQEDEELPCWSLRDGCWVLALPAPDASGVQLDASVEALRLSLDGAALELPWPRPVAPGEVDHLEAKFSKKNCELRVLLPAEAPQEPLQRDGPSSARPPSPPAAGSAARRAVEEPPSAAATAPNSAPASLPRTAAPTPKPTTKVASGYAAEPDMNVLMLHSAAAIGDASRVRSLLEGGVDADSPDERGASALEKACLSGHLVVAELLLAKGARAEGLPGAPSTPLHRALSMGERPGGEKLIELLLEHQANPRIKDAAGRSAAAVARELHWPRSLLQLASQ